MTTPADTILPPLPKWPDANMVLLSRSQWAILGNVLLQLHNEHEYILQVLAQLSTGVEPLMTMPTSLADIQASLASAATTAEQNESTHKAEVVALKSSVDGLIAAFQKHSTTLDPAVAADLESNISRVVAASADLATQTTSLTAVQHSVDTANPAP